ncbi:hypothetical protein B0H14DRAFT_2584054 [Mycena olivaceomarginata]|nr:hypothetical protein B0H14DRAFT_2584054 [Mycena olivaceomarginata]
MTFFYFDVSGQSAHIKVKKRHRLLFLTPPSRSLPVLQPTTLGQLGDDRISDQLSHQFDLRNVRWNNAGVESWACVGTNENTVNVSYLLSCVGFAEGSLINEEEEDKLYWCSPTIGTTDVGNWFKSLISHYTAANAEGQCSFWCNVCEAERQTSRSKPRLNQYLKEWAEEQPVPMPN